MTTKKCPKQALHTVRNSEFQRKIDHYQQMARSEPIEITSGGRRDLVLLSAEEYDWLRALTQRRFYTKDLPETVIEAVERAEMDPRHEHLNELLK